jgi:hypothetical protein
MMTPIAFIGTLGVQELFIILICVFIVVGLVVLPFWFICKKAGLSPWLSLLMLVPFGALILPFILAFIDWPVLRIDKSNQSSN